MMKTMMMQNNLKEEGDDEEEDHRSDVEQDGEHIDVTDKHITDETSGGGFGDDYDAAERDGQKQTKTTEGGGCLDTRDDRPRPGHDIW